MNRKVLGTISALIGVALLIASVYGVYNGWTMHGTGNVSMIKVYFDDATTQEAKTLDFGTLSPGDTNTLNLWVKNFGTDSKILTLIIDNWQPSNAVNYITITWDREASSITGGQVLSCAISLQLLENILNSSISSYSFDATVTTE